MAILQFNAATVAPSQAFEPLPAGWYNVRIIKSEMKPTSKGDGSYLELSMSVIDGPAANRQLFDRLNLNNKNQTAKDIAYQTLSAICHATGVIQLQDSTQLHGIPLMARVAIKPAEGKYEAGNEIKGYKAIASGASAVPAFVTAQTAPAASSVPSWVQPAQTPILNSGLPGNGSGVAPAPAVAPAVAPGSPVPPWAQS